MRYRAKPAYIEAVQFTRANWDEVVTFTDGEVDWLDIERYSDGRCRYYSYVPTKLGKHLVVEGDYIIKDGNGIFIVKAQEFFEQEYEAVLV